MNTNSARSIDVISSVCNRKYENDVTRDRYHEQSSHGNSSTDEKEDDSNSGQSNYHYDVFDGVVQHFPLDHDQISASGDLSYRKRRLKNNEAARKSREKRRRLDAELRRQLELVIAENRSLRLELKLLRTACGLPTTGEAIATVTDVTSSTSNKSASNKQITVTSLPLPPLKLMTSSDVKLEPEDSDKSVSTVIGVESATLRKGDRFPVSMPTFFNATGCSSVHHDMTSSDGIGRLRVAASSRYDSSGDSRERSTSSRVGDDVDWKQSSMIGTPDGIVAAFHGCNAEPLNLSTDASVSYETTPTRMLCV